MDYALPDGLEDRVLSPALVVDLGKVRRNLAVVLGLCGGNANKWRPHLKTTKCSRVWLEVLRAGVRHFKVATTREAELLLRLVDRLLSENEEGAMTIPMDDLVDPDPRFPVTSWPAVVDVLIAYPLVGPALRRAGQLARAHPRVRLSVLVECVEAAKDLPPRVGAFVDVNPGMDRTGIAHAAVVGNEGGTQQVVDVVRAAGPSFRGVHYYEGHLSECCAAVGASDDDVAAALAARDAKCTSAYDVLASIVAAINVTARAVVPEVITSGTPGFTHALNFDLKSAVDRELDRLRANGSVVPPQLNPDVARVPWPEHRVSPGTVVFHDWRGERQNPGLGLAPAAVLMARVVSIPSPGKVVTLDCGSKAIAAEAGDPAGYVLGRPEWTAMGCSEEHLPCAVDGGRGGGMPKRGDVVFVVPEHICPTVNLAEKAVLVDGGEFVGVVDIEGRAHEVMLEDDAFV